MRIVFFFSEVRIQMHTEIGFYNTCGLQPASGWSSASLARVLRLGAGFSFITPIFPKSLKNRVHKDQRNSVKSSVMALMASLSNSR